MSRRAILVKIYAGSETMSEIRPIVKTTVKTIVTQQVKEYGRVTVKLSEIMNKKNITRNRLATVTGSKYPIVDRYYKGENIAWVDLAFLAKVCYVLDCRIEDLLEYEKPEESDPQDT